MTRASTRRASLCSSLAAFSVGLATPAVATISTQTRQDRVLELYSQYCALQEESEVLFTHTVKLREILVGRYGEPTDTGSTTQALWEHDPDWHKLLAANAAVDGITESVSNIVAQLSATPSDTLSGVAAKLTIALDLVKQIPPESMKYHDDVNLAFMTDAVRMLKELIRAHSGYGGDDPPSSKVG